MTCCAAIVDIQRGGKDEPNDANANFIGVVTWSVKNVFETCRSPRVIKNTRVLKHAPPLETHALCNYFNLKTIIIFKPVKLWMCPVLSNFMKHCDFFLLLSMSYILRKNLFYHNQRKHYCQYYYMCKFGFIATKLYFLRMCSNNDV